MACRRSGKTALSEAEKKTQARSASGTEQAAHGILGEGSDGRASGDPDYDEVVGLSEVVIAPHITDTILESDRGPEVAYYLAQHPDKAEAINAMSPIAAARAIGRIEASLPGCP